MTWLLQRINRGEVDAADELLPLVYEELQALARRAFASGGPQTLQATALVHEAFLRLLGPSQGRADYENRRHFFAVAAHAMRRVLADYARGSARLKRGGGSHRVTLDERHGLDATGQATEVDLLDLHEALEELEQASSRIAKVVELRFLAGLTMEEVAAELGISSRAVFKDWRAGRAILARRFGRGEV